MMQSMKHIAYRILQLLSAILFLALAAGLINQNGPFAAVPKILKWIMILGFVGFMCGLIGVIPAVASTQMPALVPVLFDIIMALVFLTTAIVLSTRVGLRSCSPKDFIMTPDTTHTGLSLKYLDTSRFWTPTIVMGHAGDGYLHPKQWEKRCHMNKAISAFLFLGSLSFIASAIFGVARYMQQMSKPLTSVTPRLAKDDLVVVPEIKEVA